MGTGVSEVHVPVPAVGFGIVITGQIFNVDGGQIIRSRPAPAPQRAMIARPHKWEVPIRWRGRGS